MKPQCRAGRRRAIPSCLPADDTGVAILSSATSGIAAPQSQFRSQSPVQPEPADVDLATREPSLLRTTLAGRAAGLAVALAIGAAFVGFKIADLPVNFQIDGQIPEYLAWATAPDALGPSLNRELNSHLYSFYYAGLGFAAEFVDHLTLLQAVFALEILGVSAAVYFLVLTLTTNRWAGWLAVAVVIWHNGMTVAPGGSSGIGIVAGAQYAALPFALFALAASWRRRHITAALLAGLSFNLHGSAAIFVSFMVVAAAMADGGWRMSRRVLLAGAVCLVSAAPTLIWIAMNPPPAATISTALWLQFPKWIYVNHIFVSATPVRLWLMLFAFSVPGVLGLAAGIKRWGPQRSVLTGWIAATALLLTVGIVFVELIPVRIVATLALWRGTVFLILVLLAFGLDFLTRDLRLGGFESIAAAMALATFLAPNYPELSWIGHLGLAGLLAITITRGTGAPRYVAAAALAILAGILVYDASCFDRIGEHIRWRWPVAVAGVVVLFVWSGRARSWLREVATPFAMIALAVWLFQLDVARPFSSQVRQRAAAILEMAPMIESTARPGELVIAPPDIRNPGAWAGRGSFLCRQQLTAYAYAPWLAERLLQRMQWYVDDPIERHDPSRPMVQHLLDGYRAKDSTAFARLHDEYGVRLAVVERGQSLSYQRIAANDLFAMYDLDAPLP